jgi:hypothetical protein
MGNVCGSFDGVDHGPQPRNDRLLYASQHVSQYRPPERFNQQAENSSEQKRSSHSSSPQRERGNGRTESNGPAITFAMDGGPDAVPAEDQWRIPAAPGTPGGLGHPQDHQAYEQGEQQEAAQEQQEPFNWTQVGHPWSTLHAGRCGRGGSAPPAARRSRPPAPCLWLLQGELIGIGAFGRVFSGLNNNTGELVAVKQVSFAKDEAVQGRVAEHLRALEMEVDVLKTLKHENIVQVGAGAAGRQAGRHPAIAPTDAAPDTGRAPRPPSARGGRSGHPPGRDSSGSNAEVACHPPSGLQYLGTERTDDAINIFLEFVPGGSIASLLAKFGPLQVRGA